MKNSVYTQTLKKMSGKTPTSVNKKIFGRENEMIPNMDGGFSFEASDITQLNRFLMLGSCHSLVSANASGNLKEILTEENTKNILKVEPSIVRQMIEEVSCGRKTFNNDFCLYALAVMTAHPKLLVRQFAFDLLPKVARTGTDLFHFIEFFTSIRKWSSNSRKNIANWYLGKRDDDLVFQTLKYQQRDGWSHKDVIRLCHPKTKDEFRNSYFDWLVNGNEENLLKYLEKNYPNPVPENFKNFPKYVKLIVAFMALRSTDLTENEVVAIISNTNCPHEFIPSEFKNKPKVQEALLKDMPYMATVRNLAGYTASGLIKPLSKAEKLIYERLTNDEHIQKSGIHPLALLVAHKTYGNGQGFKGSLNWIPSQRILTGLNEAYYKSFKYIKPSGKRFVIGVDMSGSMSGNFNDKPLKYSEVAGCIAASLVATEPWTLVQGFNSRLVTINIDPKENISSVAKKCSGSGYTTNAGLTIENAIDKKLEVDCFIHITDNDFNSGKHPWLLLQQYNKLMNRNAKYISISLTATKCQNFPENDPNCLEISGFSTDIPAIVSAFAKGEI